MTFSAGDAHDYCVYKGRYRFAFPILDADGDPVTAAAGLDSLRSIDFAAGAACTNEATEFTTNPLGMYFLDLTSAETTGSNVSGITKTSTVGAKTTPWSIPIVRLPILESGTAQAGAAGTITLASGASAKDGFYTGLFVQCSNDTPANVLGQTRKIISYVGSTRVATVESNWGTNPSSSTTYDILVPKTVNIAAILGQRIPDWTIAGVQPVDTVAWKGTAVATPGTTGVPSVDTLRIGGTVQTARDIGASVLLSTGTGTGQLDFASGVVKASLVQILGTVISGTAAQIAAAFTKFFDKATPTGTINSLPDAVAGASGGVFIAGTNAATAVTTALTANLTGNVSGSVGSVTGNVGGNITGSTGSVVGAVGSVIGNVGGNVTGSVGSVTGAVGSVTGNVGGNVTGSVGSVTGLTAANLDATISSVKALLPAALVSGRLDASVGAIAANVITAAATASDFGAEVADAVWDEALSGHVIAGSSGAGLSGAAAPSAATVADAVWDEVLSGHLTGGTAGASLNGAGSTGDPWTATLPGEYADGTAGKIFGDRIDATITSRATPTNVSDVQTAVLAKLPTALVSGRMDASVGAMQTGTITDAALAADAKARLGDIVWDEPMDGHLTSGTAGDMLNAADAASDPWTTLLPGAYAAGTAGQIIGDRIDALISGRAAPSDITAVQTTILSKLPSDLVGGRMNSSIGSAQANVINAAALATDAGVELASAVWNEPISGHAAVLGSTAASLVDAGMPPSNVAISAASIQSIIAGISAIAGADPIAPPGPTARTFEKIDYICAQFNNLQIVNKVIGELVLYRQDGINKISTVKFSKDEDTTRRDAAI